MRICVVGAGAIGGLLAAKLAHAGEDVSVIARGAHLAGIVENGLSLLEEGQEIVARVVASDRIAGVGEQDLIILGMKAHQVAAVVRDLLRSWVRKPQCSLRKMEFPGGISSSMEVPMRAPAWKVSIQAALSRIIC